MRATDLELSALTLDEVLSENYVPLISTASSEARADLRMTRWCEICADGDWDIFRRRLHRDGLSFEAARRRLGKVDRREGVSEPGWVADCRGTLDALKDAAPFDAPGAADHAFGALLAPLVATAINDLAARSAFWQQPFVSPRARGDLVRPLWRNLVELCGLPLYRSLTNWRRASRSTEKESNQVGFGNFAVFMREGGFAALFAEYPSLLRLVALVRRQWVENCAEFIGRLGTDRAQLGALDPSITLGSILTGVRSGLSDPHDGGRTVLIATFDSKARVVYKPKDLSADLVMESALRVMRDHGFPHPLRIPRVLTRSGYGWTAFVEPGECREASDVDDYFRRAGAWLGLFYVICASDMHMENLLACGSDPVPVDFETIFQGRPRRPRSGGAEADAAWLAISHLERSVLTVGLLPVYVRSDNEAVSVGGLEPSTVSKKHVVWRDIHSTSIRPELVTEASTTTSNLPTFRGELRTLKAHREPLLKGFRATLVFLAGIAPEMASWVERTATRNLQVRRVLRPTRFYYLLLRRLCDFRSMSDSVTWSMQTEIMARLFDWETDAEEHWELFAEERAALTQLNIPAFRLAADGTATTGGRGAGTSLHIDTGVRSSLDRIGALTDGFIAEQARIVEASLRMDRGGEGNREASAQLGSMEEARAAPPIDLPSAIFRHLCDGAFRDGRTAAWLSLELYEDQDAAQIAPMGYDLYGGSCGIAMFLAAYARTRGSSMAAEMARAAIVQAAATVRSANKKRLVRALGMGGGVGVGSLVYGLATVAQLLGDADALHAAASAAEILTEEVIRRDDYFDLIGGAAGCCLSLLKLYRLTGDSTVLARALHCAEHLEANRPTDGALWSSSSFGHKPLTGVSHGASGYALAFSRLFAATGVERFRQAARSCVEFENVHYDASRRNWPDLRSNPKTGKHWWPIQWCYGACGIGYARIAMAAEACLDSGLIETDVRNAAEATLRATPYSNDTLCCGVAGQADFLLEAGGLLRDDALKAAAAARIAEIGLRWSGTGDARWDVGTKQYNLGLFRGVAGIGYAALRIEDPLLPRVLAWL